MEWALVTGGAKGVGRAICLALAREGKNIVIHFRTSEKEAREVQRKCLACGVQAEVIDGEFSGGVTSFIDRYLERFSHTEAVVHNVGQYETTPLLDLSVEKWNAIYQTNLTAPFAITQALLPSLKRAKGAVVHLGVAGLDLWRTDPHSSAYRMTKMGLWMLTRSLAHELVEAQVRVNMVSPGQLQNSVNAPDPSHLPMQRLGKVEEIADVVAFLLSEKGAYITGQNIEVAGGYKLF